MLRALLTPACLNWQRADVARSSNHPLPPAQVGSAWRKLTSRRQALLVLAYLRQGETFAELAVGFGIGTATAWRYARETVAPAGRPLPKLRRALRDARRTLHAYLVIDRTLLLIDRVAANCCT